MENTGNNRKSKRKQSRECREFLDMILSWSLYDILNNNLYKYQVEEVPLTFSSTAHYMSSFNYLLLEETHADLLSHLTGIIQAPASPISSLKRIPNGSHNNKLYSMTLSGMDYEPRFGDLIALTQVKLTCVDDLASSNTCFLSAYVTQVIDERLVTIKISSSDLMESNLLEIQQRQKGFVVYLTNLTTNMRIWQALNSSANMNVVHRTLSFTSVTKDCDNCVSYRKKGIKNLKLRQTVNLFNLNTSQEAAVLSCLSAKNHCHENSCTKLISGPPGTGKTKTVAAILFVLLRTNRRTLTCAPTNIAVVGVVKRLLSLLSVHDLGCDTYGFGDIVLFGNEERMRINIDHEELLDVFLDNRVDVLSNCLSMWKTYTSDMIRLLENPMKEHQCSIVPKETKTKSKSKRKESEQKPDEKHEDDQLTFEEFAKSRFSFLSKNLIACIRDLYTHLPTSVITLHLAKKMKHSIDLIEKVGESVKEIVTKRQNLKEAFDNRVDKPHFKKLRLCKTECLKELNDLREATFIPKSTNIIKLTNYCLRNACLIFCTASSSIRLYRKGMPPIELVVIDEAAQLKECESAIPLQVPGVRNAVLVGDEKQLPSMVQSKICEKANFGRSLFERLVLLGHHTHLLNVQYRMHPSISQFPNAEFYNGQILDGPNVMDIAREKRFLKEHMYGSYSFINVESAYEEFDNKKSTKNMVEVVVIAEIITHLFKESVSKKQKVTVGCISPYTAQVDAIEKKLGKEYDQEENDWSFSVNVRTIDGFQGGEEDIIIFSTVRCNDHGSVGFLTSRERANVALTRARHCLWIVGNKETLINSGSVWKTLVSDAENRGCVFDAHKDKNMAEVMVDTMVESTGFVNLLKTDSILFKDAIWKVNFTHLFLKRVAAIRNSNVRKQVVSLLQKLSNGWRQGKKNKSNTYNDTRAMLDMLEIYSVNGHYYLVWSVDIVYEKSLCFQVLKFWDILLLSQIKQRAKRLKKAFKKYTPEMISRCQTKHSERNLVLPMTWPVDLAQDPTQVLTSELANLSLNKKKRSKC
ncbi:putative P-loop containing nucleoside triphosphate hydrolase, DNA2/NAM7 helicase, helicase [Helianthus debilis subsp. tardiflorus]